MSGEGIKTKPGGLHSGSAVTTADRQITGEKRTPGDIFQNARMHARVRPIAGSDG